MSGTRPAETSGAQERCARCGTAPRLRCRRERERVNGHRFSTPTAYTPEGKLVTLLAHTRFHRVRHQQAKGMSSPLDPRLEEHWEERRERSLLRRLVADGSRLRRYLLRRQRNRCAITGLPIAVVSEVEIHHIIPTHVGGNDDWGNLCLVFPWAHTALHARHQGDYSRASLNDVPFSGI